ncbi:ABC transporter substrate-binding protein [Natrinema soli]|uniref:Thiamine pyrimidine synthase n=1 Tax=Natrinema soli TaxID=1930624 RepID=A0ABD5SLX1_9EURY|nr:ABC transporter substrate-binding protein [Natrinema soli]
MRSSRRQLLATLGSGTLAGCFGGSDSEGAKASLLLNWKPNGLHVPYFTAAERGFYEAETLELTGIEPGEGSDFSATQAGLGNSKFAITSAGQVLNANANELDVIAVGIIMQRGPVQVFTARDNFGAELSGSEQLAGVTLGSGPGMVRQMTEAYLEHEGVLDDVEYVDSGFDTVQQLLSGEIDAASGVFSDVVDARHQGYDIETLSVTDVIPSYGHVIATSRSFAESNPDTVRSFLRATARGAVWANDNPDDATGLLLEAVPELEDTRANQRDKWNELRTEFMLSEAVREHGWGWNESAVWESLRTTLADGDYPGGDVTSEDAWTNDYLDTDDEHIGEYGELVEPT